MPSEGSATFSRGTGIVTTYMAMTSIWKYPRERDIYTESKRNRMWSTAYVRYFPLSLRGEAANTAKHSEQMSPDVFIPSYLFYGRQRFESGCCNNDALEYVPLLVWPSGYSWYCHILTWCRYEATLLLDRPVISAHSSGELGLTECKFIWCKSYTVQAKFEIFIALYSFSDGMCSQIRIRRPSVTVTMRKKRLSVKVSISLAF